MATPVDRLLAEDGAAGPRADARRNVQRLVDAARSALAEDGVQVTSREIARRAGVGIGTFYRRLPSREALLSAILTDTVAEMIAAAATALDDPDPWHGFSAFAEVYVQLRAASCGLNDALSGIGGLDLDHDLATLRTHVRRLVRKAQAAGTMRGDIGWTDVPFILATAIPADHTIGLVAKPDQWRRNLRVVLAGLRAGGQPPQAVTSRRAKHQSATAAATTA